MGRSRQVVVVIPARNEEARLPALLPRVFDALKPVAAHQVVVVDDGSTDETAALAGLSGARVLSHPINMGKGSALLTGCDGAVMLGATHIVAMDADGQHRPEDLPGILAPVLEGRADVCLAAREFEGEMPAVFRLGNVVLNDLLRRLFGITVADSQCGFRSFTVEAYPVIRWTSRDYAVESEMLVRMARAGLSFEEFRIPAIYHDRHKGTQPVDGLSILGQLLRWRMAGI